MNSLRKLSGQSFGSLTLAFPLSPRLGGRRTPPACLQALQVALYEITEPKTFSILDARLLSTYIAYGCHLPSISSIIY